MIKAALIGLAALVAIVPAQATTVVGATKIVVTSAIPTWIQVAELQAFDLGNVDVALASNGATASASSVYLNGPAVPAYAIDGVTIADYPNIFHSGSPNAGEYLEVDFAAPATLSGIKIFGRAGCCQDRDLFNVSVYNAENVVLYSGTLDARYGAVGAVSFVPEASQWVMLIAGFGMVGATMRRRKAALA